MKSILLSNGMNFSSGKGNLFGSRENEQYDEQMNWIGYNDEGRIGAVIESFPKEEYIKLLSSINCKGGYGSSGDLFLLWNSEKEMWEFAVLHGPKDCHEPSVFLSYSDGMNLFHLFFNSFYDFIENEHPEVKDECTNNRSNFNKDTNKFEPITYKWYPEFVEALEEFNKVYQEGVKKGEIIDA